MKVALVYDRVNKFGGAERVLLALHEIWPEAPLYTSVYEPNKAPWASVFEVRTSFLQKLPLPKDRHELYPFLMGRAFETFNFDQFDVVVSVTHEFSKAIITKPQTVHLCYCLNPVGYLWANYEDYFSHKSTAYRLLTMPLIRYLRWYDQIVCFRPDQYVAISKTVQERIRNYYGQESAVIYPPIESQKKNEILSPAFGGLQNDIKKGRDYFLIVSRLVPNKRIDIAVEAFNALGWPLVIIGVGIEEQRLKSLAKNNIQFLGGLTDEQLASYYRSCRAFVIPGEEDFGITAVEAQSFGKPVIAFGKGGVTETVIEGKTGLFFSEQTAGPLISSLEAFVRWQFDPKKCQQNAQKFSKERFKQEFQTYINNL